MLLPPKQFADGRFERHEKLGKGSFGEVYRAVDRTTGEEVAIKVEDAQQHDHLMRGYELLSLLHASVRAQGFAECLHFGREGRYNCLVMELLDRNLEERHREYGRRFSPQTVASIGYQILCRVEYLHAKGVVHGDIKPDNVMSGRKGKSHHLYLIDFGLSERYWSPTTESHVPLKKNRSLTGTVRYASLNAHRGLTQSRRDDLEAVGHMLIYFLRGSLPWSGLSAEGKQDRYQRISEVKEQVTAEELCEGFPEQFEEFLRYCRGLEFEERPDYDMLRGLLMQVCEDGPADERMFPWLDCEHQENVPLQPWINPLQPEDVHGAIEGEEFHSRQQPVSIIRTLTDFSDGMLSVGNTILASFLQASGALACVTVPEQLQS